MDPEPPPRRRLSVPSHRIWLPVLSRRVLFVVGGLSVGAIAIAMAKLADGAQEAFAALREAWPLAPVLVTPAGFGLSAWLTRRFAPTAGGSGIPQVIAAMREADPAAQSRLVSLKVAAAKIVLLILGLLCGASAGREGPTVQVGAAAMAAMGRLARHREPGLLLAGSAAGVAAAFNAPLAGLIFGIEEMSRSFEVRTSGLILGTVIAAGFTSLAILGDYAYFGITPEVLPLGPAWVAVPVAGIVCGLAGGLFSRGIVAMSQGLPGRPGAWIKAHPVAFAVLCGLGVVACAFAADGTVFGTGYAQAQAVLRGDAGLPLAFAPAKLVATALSSVSGIPGGLFSPSLAVGAGIARDLAPLLPPMPLAVLGVLCMAAYLAGVVQAPLTSFVIVAEMTSDHALVVPIMLSSLIASQASRLVCPDGVYHALARRFAAPDRELAPGP